MSDQMSASPATASPATASPTRAAEGPGALRIIGLAAVGLGLAALAGAAFVLSYGGIHAFAVEAGISTRLARGYPLIFDVLLVVILAAVLALRGAGLPSKVLAWACLLALLAAAAGADALHAAGRKLPARDAAVTGAVVPWVLVLIALALLLAMLRHARLRRLAANRVPEGGDVPTRWQPQEQPPASVLPLVPGFGRDDSAVAPARVEPAPAAGAPGVKPFAFEARPPQQLAVDAPAFKAPRHEPVVPRLVVPRQVTAESAADNADLSDHDWPASGETSEAELAIDAEPAPDDPSSDETPVSLAVESALGQPADSAGRDSAGGDSAGRDSAGGDSAGEDSASLDGAGRDSAIQDTAGQDTASHDTASQDTVSRDGAEEHAGVEDSDNRGESGGHASETGEATDPEMPVFHRMWSSPVPPAGD